MNKFDDKYEIRIANQGDIDSIMQFIRMHWKKDHILSIDREYFEYEFVDEDKVNFILAICRQTNEIEAILGFLKASNSSEKKDIWGSFWKVNDSHDNEKLLGVELEKRVEELTHCRYHNGIGINPRTAVPLVRFFLKNTVQKMNHFYMLNDSLSEYKIAQINHKQKQKSDLQESRLSIIKDFTKLKERFDICNNDNVPYKDEWYVQKKFFMNPKRNYIVYGINAHSDESRLDAFFVARECEANGKKVLRILDYYGDRQAFSRVGKNLRDCMLKNEYEYIDFYSFGFEKEYILQAGFIQREDDDKNIIPNYFEPFVKQNIDIWVHYKNEGTLFYKADGDQDRANI